MSAAKLISSMQIISEFIEFGNDSENLIPQLHRYVNRVIFRLGSEWNYEAKIIVRQTANNKIQLPDNTAHVLGIVVGDHSENINRDVFGMVYSQNKSIIEDNDGQFIYYWNAADQSMSARTCEWKVKNNYIQFEENIDDDTDITIDLLVKQVDQNGFVMINENNAEVALKYIELQMSQRNRYRAARSNKLTGTHMQYVREVREEYAREWRLARADEGDMENNIVSISKLLNHPLKGFGNVFIYDK